ncbi:hypothetical protein [Clostridium mobile]|nr:hypothetical protein [Clostridium mobile]
MKELLKKLKGLEEFQKFESLTCEEVKELGELITKEVHKKRAVD